MPINISICESDFNFKELLIQNIEDDHTLNLNNCYNNGYELVNKLNNQHNDFLIINTYTHIMTGFEAVKLLRLKNNMTPIIVYSSVYQQEIPGQLSQFPYIFYCQKNSTFIFTLLKAIQKKNYRFYLDYLKEWRDNPHLVNNYITRQQTDIYKPTLIELRIIHYVCQRLTNIEIGEKVNLSPRTIECYIKKLTVKFAVKNKKHLIGYCIGQNLHNFK